MSDDDFNHLRESYDLLREEFEDLGAYTERTRKSLDTWRYFGITSFTLFVATGIALILIEVLP